MAGGTEHGVYTHAHYFEGADYIAAQQFGESWDGDFSPRSDDNLALLNARVELGAIYNNWRIAAFYRKEILINSNKDSTKLIHLNQQRQDVLAGSDYDIRVSMKSYEIHGLRLDQGTKFDLTSGSSLSVGAGVSLLTGMAMREANAKGRAGATSTGYVFDLALEDIYSEGEYPFINNRKPEGKGYALDFAAELALDNGLRVQAIANDLFAKLYWDNLPSTSAVADSETLTRDTQGYVSYNPTVKGHNDLDRRSYTQNLQPKIYVGSDYTFDNWTLNVGDNWISANHFPQLGVAYRFNPNLLLALDYDLRQRSTGVLAKTPWFYVKLKTDTTNFSASKSHQISLGGLIAF